MQRTAEDMNDDQDSESQAPDSESQGDASNAFAPEPTEDTKAFNISRNASEAAGETIAVVGEGALSASFIPVYANLLARGNDEEANRVASAVLTLLALVTSVIVLVGVLTTPYIISIVALGFIGDRRDLAIQLVQIFFPGAGL